jgi:hypothetical protein
MISATFRCGSTYYGLVSKTNVKYALLTPPIAHLDKIRLYKCEPLLDDPLNVTATLIHIADDCYQFSQQSATQHTLDTQGTKTG